MQDEHDLCQPSACWTCNLEVVQASLAMTLQAICSGAWEEEEEEEAKDKNFESVYEICLGLGKTLSD